MLKEVLPPSTRWQLAAGTHSMALLLRPEEAQQTSPAGQSLLPSHVTGVVPTRSRAIAGQLPTAV